MCEKYYVVDSGLRFMLLGYRDADWGHLLENMIYLELFRRGYSIFIGKVGTAEVDFVAQKGDETVYYQVAATLRSSETLGRELRPLRAIADDWSFRVGWIFLLFLRLNSFRTGSRVVGLVLVQTIRCRSNGSYWRCEQG